MLEGGSSALGDPGLLSHDNVDGWMSGTMSMVGDPWQLRFFLLRGRIYRVDMLDKGMIYVTSKMEPEGAKLDHAT